MSVAEWVGVWIESLMFRWVPSYGAAMQYILHVVLVVQFSYAMAITAETPFGFPPRTEDQTTIKPQKLTIEQLIAMLEDIEREQAKFTKFFDLLHQSEPSLLLDLFAYQEYKNRVFWECYEQAFGSPKSTARKSK